MDVARVLRQTQDVYCAKGLASAVEMPGRASSTANIYMLHRPIRVRVRWRGAREEPGCIFEIIGKVGVQRFDDR
jgi:hypothetical protein